MNMQIALVVAGSIALGWYLFRVVLSFFPRNERLEDNLEERTASLIKEYQQKESKRKRRHTAQPEKDRPAS